MIFSSFAACAASFSILSTSYSIVNRPLLSNFSAIIALLTSKKSFTIFFFNMSFSIQIAGKPSAKAIAIICVVTCFLFVGAATAAYNCLVRKCTSSIPPFDHLCLVSLSALVGIIRRVMSSAPLQPAWNQERRRPGETARPLISDFITRASQAIPEPRKEPRHLAINQSGVRRNSTPAHLQLYQLAAKSQQSPQADCMITCAFTKQ